MEHRPVILPAIRGGNIYRVRYHYDRMELPGCPRSLSRSRLPVAGWLLLVVAILTLVGLFLGHR